MKRLTVDMSALSIRGHYRSGCGIGIVENLIASQNLKLLAEFYREN